MSWPCPGRALPARAAFAKTKGGRGTGPPPSSQAPWAASPPRGNRGEQGWRVPAGNAAEAAETGPRGLQGLILSSPAISRDVHTQDGALQHSSHTRVGGVRTPGPNSPHPPRWSGARTDSCAGRRTLLLPLLPTGLKFRLRGPRPGCNYKPGRGPIPLPAQLLPASPSPSPVVPVQGDRGRPLSCPESEAQGGGGGGGGQDPLGHPRP